MVLSWSKTQNVNHGAWSYVQEVLCYVAYYPTDILRHILFTGAVSVLVVNNEFIDTKRCSESAGKAITEYSNCEANTCGQYGSCVPARTLQGYYCYCAADGMPSMSCDRKLSPLHHSTQWCRIYSPKSLRSINKCKKLPMNLVMFMLCLCYVMLYPAV